MSADRDRILEQALKHELRGEESTTPHLDPETLAAWQDEALDAAQMETIELHVSSCARCQSMLAAFARGTTAPPISAPAVETPRFQWWRWWLAPLAAGAAAVTLWMVVPEQQREIATAPPSPTASVASTPAAPPPAADLAQKVDAQPSSPEKRARAADSDLKENKLKVEAPRDDRQQLKDEAVAAPKQEVAMAQPTAPPSPASTAPMAPAAAAREEVAGARSAELQKSTRFAFAPLEVPTLDRSVRWRVTGNRIERTDDAGQTWASKHERLGENIAAGSAPSSTVAWFAGRAGIVILTTDAGATFVEVGLSEPLDIASISATDARRAVISTVAGRRFQTDDGGRTWRSF